MIPALSIFDFDLNLGVLAEPTVILNMLFLGLNRISGLVGEDVTDASGQLHMCITKIPRDHAAREQGEHQKAENAAECHAVE